jgi:hypothetical protein
MHRAWDARTAAAVAREGSGGSGAGPR